MGAAAVEVVVEMLKPWRAGELVVEGACCRNVNDGAGVALFFDTVDVVAAIVIALVAVAVGILGGGGGIISESSSSLELVWWGVIS